MERIVESAERIRDAVNCDDALLKNHFLEHRDEWNLLCAAMDTLDDSSGAIVEAIAEGLGTSPFEAYLRFYGFFQALILQQDSLRSIHRLILRQPFEPSPNSSWMRLRNLRNMAAGHPLDYGDRELGVLRVFLNRNSLSLQRFQILIFEEQTGELRGETIDLASVLVSYEPEALGVATMIINGSLSGPIAPAA